MTILGGLIFFHIFGYFWDFFQAIWTAASNNSSLSYLSNCPIWWQDTILGNPSSLYFIPIFSWFLGYFWAHVANYSSPLMLTSQFGLLAWSEKYSDFLHIFWDFFGISSLARPWQANSPAKFKPSQIGRAHVRHPLCQICLTNDLWTRRRAF